MANMQIVVSCKNEVEAQYVEMMVPLYSYGCERKVKKALSHLKGIYSVNVDYGQQKVTVWGICNKYDVLATIRSKRKGARFWNPDDNIDEKLDHEHQTYEDQSPDQSENQSIRPRRYNSMTLSLSRPSLSLTRLRSFNWKAMKKVFARSQSF